MPDSLPELWDLLADRAGAPMRLRLILQPTIAILLAVRAGLKDARDGETPFLWSVLARPGHRLESLRHGWGDVGKVFVLAISLDLIYQLMEYRGVRPLELLATALLLAIVPYVLVRGPLTRIVQLGRRRAHPEEEPA